MRRLIRTFRKPFIQLGYRSQPSFIIVGVQKGGTTSLFNILQKHSRLRGTQIKEITYFNNDEVYNGENLSNYYCHFPLPYRMKNDELLFEATPGYFDHPEVALRLAKSFPELKIVIILRDPVLRALSAWTMYHHHFINGRHAHLHIQDSFGDCVRKEIRNLGNNSYNENIQGVVRKGIYIEQLVRYRNEFSNSQILIIESNELRSEFDMTTTKVMNFLEVPFERLSKLSYNPSKINNKKKYPEEFELLQEFYKPHSKKLFDLIGKNYDWL